MKNFLAFFLVIISTYVSSETLNLNGLGSYYLTQNTKSDSIFLILHGTRGHQNLEIISSLRDSLYDNGIDSLSINLSYGIKNRGNDFLPCDIEHKHTMSNSLDEIDAWYKYISKIGYKHIYLVGHSRGGLDIINFYNNLNDNNQSSINSIFLIAPTPDNISDYISRYKTEYNINIETIKNDDNLKINFLGCENARVKGKSFKSYYFNYNIISVPVALSNISSKVFVITASEDSIVPLTHNKISRVIMDNNNIELYMIDGADHFFRDFYFDDLMELILDKID